LRPVRLVQHGDRVPEVFHPDSVDGDLAVVDFALGVLELYERLHPAEDTCAAGGLEIRNPNFEFSFFVFSCMSAESG
jgi:hypothetical protein